MADYIPASTATTAIVPIGTSVYGSIETIGDHDWYRVDLVAGQTYDFRLHGVGTSEITDTLLTLRDANGVEITNNDDSASWDGVNAAESRLTFTASTSGTYYLDAATYLNSGGNPIGHGTGDFLLTAAVYNPGGMIFTLDEIAWQLTNNGYELFYGTPAAFNVGADHSISYNIQGLTPEAQALAEAALRAWTDVTGIEFVPTSGGAEITFDDNAGGTQAYASSSITGTTINSSTVMITTGWLDTFGTSFNSYSFETYIHEIGHALGLGHGGNYNGSAVYGQDNYYLNDALAYSIMSYMQTKGDEFSGSIVNTFVDADFRYMLTPALADMIAIHTLYGAQATTATRTGDTVYGFNSTTGNEVLDGAVSYGSDMFMAVYDDGGNDTLDFSLATNNQVINLNDETSSNVLGGLMNLSIARGTMIENAVGGSMADTIYGNELANKLSGLAGTDTIEGGAGNDTIDGGDGIDTLRGGDDNDVFLVAAAAHHVAGEVIDGGAGTTDRIRFTSAAAGETLVLASGVTNVEIVEITNAAGSAGGTTALNLNASALGYGVTLKGNAGVNTIVGTSFVDVLEGNGGNDTLEGKSGSDIIRGGDGNDVIQIAFAVHHGATEVIDGGAGAIDRIRFLSTTAGETLNLTSGVTNVEIIEITNAAGSPGGITALNLNAAALTYGVTLNGNGGVNTITGTGFIDTISGNAGNDVIEGGAGSDILNGGDGNDVFLIASASHHTSAEMIDGGAGTTDRIRFTSTSTGQTLVLSNQVTGVEFIDISTASGSLGGTTQLNVNAAALTAAITINGNAGNNTLTGSAFADTINGNAGNDTINGGAGSDTLDGGAGNDIFRFTNTASASNIDTILNYSVADDRIEMDNTYFTALVDGWLFSNAFTANATGQATSTTQRIIYETDTGALFYDSNGSSGGGTYQQFAQLAAGLAMTAGEFFVI